MRLSVVIPLRDRSGARLDNCLRSLRWQSFPGGEEPEIEIVVVDLGSSASHAQHIRRSAEAHGARVVRSEFTGTWNRSRALNIGIRAATAEFVMCTDVDMVFRSDFLAAAARTLRVVPRALVVCRCHDLPHSDPPIVIRAPHELDQLLPSAAVRHHGGTGACQLAARSFFEEVRGYDEGYVHWGSEDKDLLARAVRHGLVVQWLDRHSAMAHQWHPTHRRDRWLRTRWNRWRYRLTARRVVKNRRGWGEI